MQGRSPFGTFEVERDRRLAGVEVSEKAAAPPLSPLCLYYPSRRNPPAAFKVFVDLARELARSSRGPRSA
ncbi:hypothetical protein B2G71_15055 [Novosphingobium sp. PC22D]|nr:hypothetical protein B2G71_15055 [Novosphingobium sp. PC22D]